MTALTTILGLVPLLLSSGLGSEVQRPLATVVVGGLVSSTLLTLLVIPVIYPWFAVRIGTSRRGRDCRLSYKTMASKPNSKERV